MRYLTYCFAVLVSAWLLVACEQQGPAERAGEKIDEAAEELGNAAEDACEDIKDAANAEDTDC